MTSSSYTTYHTIDDALQQYYQRLGYFHYNDKGGNGLFATYIIAHELYTDFEVEAELNHPYDPSNYSYLWLYFDNEFPTPYYATLEPGQKEAFKFYIVQHCYKFNKPPSDEYIANVLLPKCNVYGETAMYGTYKFDKQEDEICVDEIVDGVLQQYVPGDICSYDTSDIETKLNLFVHKWNNNPNKTSKLNLEELKTVLVTIHTNVRLTFIQLARNFDIPACAAMHIWLIVNEVLNNGFKVSDEHWPPSLCSAMNQDEISDDDNDGIYDRVEPGDDTEYIHNQCELSSCIRIMPQMYYDKWDVNLSTIGDLYYNRWVLPAQMRQLRTQMNDYQLQLDIIIITCIFEQAFALYVLCMYYVYILEKKIEGN